MGAWSGNPSADNDPEVETGADGAGSPDQRRDTKFDEIIFRQDLNEVYLLLDYISGRPDRHLSELDGRIKDEAGEMNAYAIVERVSRLRYPPDAQKAQRSKDAAFLLVLKDALNTLAYPARGLTIAYTTMFSEQGRSETSRVQAAQLAFPSLIDSARNFRRVKGLLAWSGLLITVLSAIFLWQVSYGAQLASRFDDAKRNDTLAAAGLYNQLDRDAVAGGPEPGQKGSNVVGDLVTFCKLPESGGQQAEVRSSTVRQLCNDYAYRHAQLCVAIADVAQFGQSVMFAVSSFLLPTHQVAKPGDCGGDAASGNKGRQEDAQSVAGVLSVVSNYLLPILFGLVGTMASLVRGIQDKVTDSVLAPRDRALSLIRLPLGMIAGVCVGLFLNPGSITSQSGGAIGGFTISSCGVAFLAGYGAEAFFRALDTLISRIFIVPDSGVPAGGRPPVPR